MVENKNNLMLKFSSNDQYFIRTVGFFISNDRNKKDKVHLSSNSWLNCSFNYNTNAFYDPSNFLCNIGGS